METEKPELLTVEDVMKALSALPFGLGREVEGLVTEMRRIYLEHFRGKSLDEEISFAQDGAKDIRFSMRVFLASLLVDEVCKKLARPLRDIAALSESSSNRRLSDVNTILEFVRNRLGVTVEGTAWTCKVVATPEQKNFQSVGDAIDALQHAVPAPIRDQYFAGPLWNEIVALRDKPLDETTEMKFAFAPNPLQFSLRKKIAAYLVNIVCQELLMQVTLGQGFIPGTRTLKELTLEEKEEIIAAVKDILAFVVQDLGVEVGLNEGQPHVKLA